MEQKELTNTLNYLHSELNRIETMAGTMATTEREHYQKLSGFDHRELGEIAVEEQNAARQMGTIKQMCNSMAQRVQDLQDSSSVEGGGSAVKHETH